MISSGETGRNDAPLEGAPAQKTYVPTIDTKRAGVSTTPAVDVNAPESAPEETTPNIAAVDKEDRPEEIGEMPPDHDWSAGDEIMGEDSGNPHFVNFKWDGDRPFVQDQDAAIR